MIELATSPCHGLQWKAEKRGDLIKELFQNPSLSEVQRRSLVSNGVLPYLAAPATRQKALAVVPRDQTALWQELLGPRLVQLLAGGLSDASEGWQILDALLDSRALGNGCASPADGVAITMGAVHEPTAAGIQRDRTLVLLLTQQVLGPRLEVGEFDAQAFDTIVTARPEIRRDLLRELARFAVKAPPGPSRTAFMLRFEAGGLPTDWLEPRVVASLLAEPTFARSCREELLTGLMRAAREDIADSYPELDLKLQLVAHLRASDRRAMAELLDDSRVAPSIREALTQLLRESLSRLDQQLAALESKRGDYPAEVDRLLKEAGPNREFLASILEGR
jgi:hypothetical protein